MAAVMEGARAEVATIIVDQLPDDSEEMRTAVMEWLRMHGAQLQLAGKQAVRVLVQLLVGIVLGAMLAFYSARTRPAGGPLTAVLDAPRGNLPIAFRDPLFPQPQTPTPKPLLTVTSLFPL